MKKFFKVICEIIKEHIKIIINFIKRNLFRVSLLIEFILPYIMLYVGEYVYSYREDYLIGFEIIIPIIGFMIIAFVDSLAKKLGHRDEFPVPLSRFTTTDDDGAVITDTARITEMIIYVSEVEAYLDRHGKI